MAQRFHQALHMLSSRVAPRVRAAVWKAAWSGWCTSERFQGTNHCPLGCTCFLDFDGLRHYAVCEVVGHFKRHFLGLTAPRSTERLGNMVALGLESYMPTEEDLIKRAVACYAVMMTSNHLRQRQHLSASEASDMLRSFATSAARAHPISAKVLMRTHGLGRYSERKSNDSREAHEEVQEEEICELI